MIGYDTPYEDHSNLGHDIQPGTGNTPIAQEIS